MSIGDKISDDANASDDESKKRAEAETKGVELDNADKAGNIKLRKIYSKLLFWVLILWLIAILVVFVLIGRKILLYADSVIIAFITTTTMNVIGIYLIVARYLFPSKSQ